ncbi:PREDICTED: C2 calcium-dependent domain-containing protein 4C [Ceratotherium simum simum]|uniref:C2 calcium-dependent domain-containing protein 4C n=1 Tax=Ceratotherium simum simum TaxID=73337 RepID=A0ABM0I6L0_CERSS|nr:PREDICTED: C2 calcium-dependent domain-containing protein 4C [Ceratotherium simum simum]
MDDAAVNDAAVNVMVLSPGSCPAPQTPLSWPYGLLSLSLDPGDNTAQREPAGAQSRSWISGPFLRATSLCLLPLDAAAGSLRLSPAPAWTRHSRSPHSGSLGVLRPEVTVVRLHDSGGAGGAGGYHRGPLPGVGLGLQPPSSDSGKAAAQGVGESWGPCHSAPQRRQKVLLTGEVPVYGPRSQLSSCEDQPPRPRSSRGVVCRGPQDRHPSPDTALRGYQGPPAPLPPGPRCPPPVGADAAGTRRGRGSGARLYSEEYGGLGGFPPVNEPPRCAVLNAAGASAPRPRSVRRTASSLRPPQPGQSLLKAATRHVIQVESAEDWPAEEAADAAPQAQGAMALPSVPKAQTAYGFATLAESPHTRRKESLFHSEHGALAQVGSPRAARRPGGDGALGSPSRCVSGGESDTGSSAESSPFGSPLLSRSVSLLKGFAQDSQAKVSQLKHSVGRHSSLSADDSTPDTSPGARRRLTRRAAPEPGPEPGAPRAEHAVRMGLRGSVRLLAEYEAAQARLRVRLLAAEGLYDRLCDARSINCCVGLCLVPGKLQKQRSTVIKNSRHPVFNEDFFFDGLGPASVRKLALRIKVVNKGSSLKRDTLLGEKELPLTALLPFL